jgi:hypothetical protein
MPGDAANLDALRVLLSSAQHLAQSLGDDPALRRILNAVTTLDPEDRAVLASALERGTASRRINETFARMNGVHLRINPNPRLFVRVLDPDKPQDPFPLEAEDIVPDVLRLLRRVRLMLAPEARPVWQPAVVEALGMLSDKERDACLCFVREVVALVTPVLTGTGGSDPGDASS